MIRFEKATEFNGVEPDFKPDNPRVIVKPDEFPKPLMPEDGAAYWQQMLHACRCAHLAKEGEPFDGDGTNDWAAMMPKVLGYEGETVSELLQSDPFNIRTVDQGAALVFDDFPGDVFLPLLRWLLEDGAQFRDIGVKRPGRRFTDGVILAHDLLGQAPRVVSPSAFCAKWHFMAPRPEEVLHLWAKGELKGEDAAPDWAESSLREMVDVEVVAEDATESTLYVGVGSPMHPSYPAMHGAAAGVGVLLAVLFDLTQSQRDLVNRTTANISCFRAAANVHLHQDNIAGLWVGEEVMARWLPNYLSDPSTGVDADAAEISAIAQEAKTGWLT